MNACNNQLFHYIFKLNVTVCILQKIYCYIKCTWQENTFKDELMTFKNDAEVLKNRK